MWVQAKYEVGYSWSVAVVNYRVSAIAKIWSKVSLEAFAGYRVPGIIEIGVGLRGNIFNIEN